MMLRFSLALAILVILTGFAAAQDSWEESQDVDREKVKQATTELFSAAGRGDLEGILDALAAGAGVNAYYGDKGTPLCEAVRYSHHHAAQLLLMLGADVNARAPKQHTPLILSALRQDREMAELLLSHGARHKNTNEYEMTALNTAASRLWLLGRDEHISEERLLDYVNLLLDHRADPNTISRGGHTPLYNAVKYGAREVALRLLQAGARPHRPGPAEPSALHLAAEHGYVDLVEPLARAGEAVDVRGKFGESPLYTAATEGNAEVAMELVRLGADVTLTAFGGKTALHGAADTLEYDLCVLLLWHGADVNARTDFGWTPLHLAVSGFRQSEHPAYRDVIRLLLENGADPNMLADNQLAGTGQDPRELVRGWAPLHEVADIGTACEVELLVSHGASIDQLDVYGLRPLERAALHGNASAYEALIRLGAKPDLACAVYRDDEAQLLQLLASGAVIDARFGKGLTALHIACLRDMPRLAQLLLERGADPNIADDRHKTPLFYCKTAEKLPLMKALIDAGADPNYATTGGYSVLHDYAAMGDPDNVQLLLRLSTDVDVRSQRGETPLMYATRECMLSNMALLLEQGADPNLRDTKGNTALHQRSNHFQGIKLLLDYGADPSLVNDEGESALDISRCCMLSQEEREELRRMLEQ